MDQTDTSNKDAKLNDSVAKINDLAEKINESLAKLNATSDRIGESAIRIERARAGRGSLSGALFWLLLLLIAAMMVLYFVPTSGVKPYVDRAGMKLGQIGTGLTDTVSAQGENGQAADKTDAAHMSASTPSYPAYPEYPAYPPYSNLMDLGGQQAQNAIQAQGPGEAIELEKAAPAKQQAQAEQAQTAVVAVKPALTRLPAKLPVAKQEAAKSMVPQTSPTPPAPAAKKVPPYPTYPAYPAYPSGVAGKAAKPSAASAAAAPVNRPVGIGQPGAQSVGVVEPAGPVLVARKAARERRYGTAIHTYESYLETNPGDADAWGELGNVLLSAGRPREAAQNYYEASTRLIDQGRVGAVYPLLPVVKQYQPQLAIILHQKMARLGY